MKYDRNYAYFITHTDWYTEVKGIGYVPTDKAPPEAVNAMKTYNAYTFNPEPAKKHK